MITKINIYFYPSLLGHFVMNKHSYEKFNCNPFSFFHFPFVNNVMNSVKSVAICCGAMGIGTLVAGALLFFGPIINPSDSASHHLTESILGMCITFVSILWFIAASILHCKIQKMEAEQEPLIVSA
jgi:hypothetical protein